MITLDFYNNGLVVNGHDIEKICWVVSYATWSKYLYIEDETNDFIYFQSGDLKETERLGLTYLISEHPEAKKQIEYLYMEMKNWNEYVGENRLKINKHDCNYNLEYDYHKRIS